MSEEKNIPNESSKPQAASDKPKGNPELKKEKENISQHEPQPQS
jgi:hypothetical protein